MQGPQAAARGPQGRQRGWDSWGRAARSWGASPSPLYITYNNLRSPSGVQGRALTQIDFYALLGPEMVTDGDNSCLKIQITLKSGGDMLRWFVGTLSRSVQ